MTLKPAESDGRCVCAILLNAVRQITRQTQPSVNEPHVCSLRAIRMVLLVIDHDADAVPSFPVDIDPSSTGRYEVALRPRNVS